MKRKIQFMAMLLIGILLSVNQVWGATSTYTFSSKAWASSVNTGGTACTWKGSSDGNQYNASTSPKGVQILASLNGLTVTSSVSFSNVTSVVVTYSSSSKGVGSIGVKIGSNTALASQSIAKSQTDKTLTFTPGTAQSGTIVITCNCTTNSYGIQSIAVTTSSGSTYTVNFNANGGSVTTTSATQASAGASISLPIPTKSGSICTGWWTASSGGTKRGDAGGSYTPTSSETLYAQWAPEGSDVYNGHTITYNLTNCTKTGGPTYSSPNLKINFQATGGATMPSDITVMIGSTKLTKGSGYTWNTDGLGTTYYLNITATRITEDVSITIVATGAKTNPTFSIDNMTIEEYSEDNVPHITTNNTDSYKITYSSSNEEVAYEDKGKIVGYGEGTCTFTATMGATNNFNQAQTTFTVTVRAAAEKYTVTFDVGENNTLDCPYADCGGYDYIHDSSIPLPSAVPCDRAAEEGWVFDGWSETKVTAGASPYSKLSNPYLPTRERTVYAVYRMANNTMPSITISQVTGTFPAAGKYIVISCQDGAGSAMSNGVLTSGGGGIHYISKAEAGTSSFSSNSITTTDATVVYEVESAGGDYVYLRNILNGKYVAKGSANDDLVFADSKGNAAAWKPIVASTKFILQNKDDATYYLRFSSGATPPSWRCTTQSTQPTGGQYQLNIFAADPALFTIGAQYSSTLTCSQTVTLSYNKNGATSGTVPVDQIYDKGATATVSANTGELVKNGYDFAGWNTNTGGTGTTYSAVSPFGSFTINANTTLYAKWTAKVTIVTLNKNGGASNGSVTLTYNSNSATGYTGVTRTGYDLEGYYTAVSDGSKILDNTGKLVGGSVADWLNEGKWIRYNSSELYAHWTPTNYTITYNDLNGATNSNPTSYTVTSETIELAAPGNRDGYRFGGWFTEADGAGTQVTQIASGSTGNKVVYAKWTAVTYTDYITQCISEYTFTLDKNTGTADGSVTFALNAPAPDAFSFAGTRTGYTLSGFNSTAGTKGAGGGTKVLNADGTIANDLSGWVADGKWIQTDESKKLYAGWTANTYEVRYNANGGTGSMANTSFAYDAAAKALRMNAFTRTGYTFQGWATTAEGAVAYTDRQTVQNLTTENNAIIDLYAVWTANTHSLTLVKGDGDCSVVTDAIPYGTEVTITANVECIPEFYRFKDWTVNTGGITLADASANPTTFTMGDKDVTITANYEEDNYTFVLDKNDGDADGSVTFTYGKSEYKTFTAATKTGYYTAGYYQYATSGSKVLETNGALNSSDVTSWIADGKWAQKDERKKLYPHWTANTYYIEYNDNGKTGGSAMERQAFRYDTPENLKTNTYTKTGYTFAGWSKVQDGAVVYTDGQEVNNLTAVNGETITLYAKWTPITYTVVYDGNGKTGGSMDPTNFTYGQAKTLRKNLYTKQGSAFLGWSLVQDGPVVYTDQQEVSNLSTTAGATVTLYAKWELQIGTINISGDVRLTSGNGIAVYTTPEASNLITLSCDNLGAANSFKIEYLDESDNVVSATKSLFRLCYAPGYEQDNSAYSVADATNIPLSSAEKEAGSYERKFAISYTPNAAGVTNVEKLRLTAMTSGNAELASATIVLNGRSLPEKFVVAMKNPNDGLWYALKNVLGSTSEGATPAPELITVDDNTNPTTATLAPASTFYKGAGRQTAGEHRGGLRLQGFNNGNLYLTATKTNNATLYTKSGNDDDQQFYLQSSDLSTYNVTLDPTAYNDYSPKRSISMSGGTIGWFTTSAKDVYFLPVAAEMTPAELQVVEWKTDTVVVMYTGAATSATTKVGASAASADQTLASAKKDHCVYELTTSDMTSAVGQLLTISFDNGSTKLIKMPWIISGAVTAETGKQGNDVVILKGATFSAAATDYRYPNITVYGGGKLVVGTGKKLSFSNLYLRCGGVVDGNYDYVYPQVVLNGTVNEGTVSTNLYIDYLTTKDQYYTFVAPFIITQASIQYPQEIYGSNVAADNKGSFEFQYYDGSARAAGGSGWKEYTSTTLGEKRGFTFLGMPKKIGGTRQKFGLHRIPMSVGTSDLKKHETESQEIFAMRYPSDKDNNSGWNLIGNPYLANVTGLTNESIQVGKLVHTEVDGQWTGGWHWDEATVTSNLRFLVIPSNDGQSYESVQASSATLPAFKNFFVQIDKNVSGYSLLIPVENRDGRSFAPGRRVEAEEKEVEIPLYIEAGEFRDQLTYLIKSDYTEAFEYNADMYKMLNNKDTRVNLYGLMESTEMSFVAVNAETMNASVPVGFSVPTAGEYLIALNEKALDEPVENLLLTDNETGITTDLMRAPFNYSFRVDQKEVNNTRFTLRAIMKKETSTDIQGADGREQLKAQKLIINDKLFILVDGKVYDGTGKLVNK